MRPESMPDHMNTLSQELHDEQDKRGVLENGIKMVLCMTRDNDVIRALEAVLRAAKCEVSA